MTRDDIIRMAREAGIDEWWDSGNEDRDDLQEHLERFAQLVAKAAKEQEYADLIRIIEASIAAEREACAKVAQHTVCDTHIPTGVKIYGTVAAKAIRARGQQ